MAAVALTAQNTSDAISGLAFRFLGAETDNEYTRSKCLRNVNFQQVAIAIRPSAQRAIAKSTCTFCDPRHTDFPAAGSGGSSVSRQQRDEPPHRYLRCVIWPHMRVEPLL